MRRELGLHDQPEQDLDFKELEATINVGSVPGARGGEGLGYFLSVTSSKDSSGFQESVQKREEQLECR